MERVITLQGEYSPDLIFPQCESIKLNTGEANSITVPLLIPIPIEHGSRYAYPVNVSVGSGDENRIYVNGARLRFERTPNAPDHKYATKFTVYAGPVQVLTNYTVN